MTTQAIADRLVELCRVGDYPTVYKELFHEDVLSIEPEGMPDNVSKGMDAIYEKGKKWNAMMEEFHGSSISEPIVAGNFFTLRMEWDATFKERGRVKDEEICLYEVKDGKIIREQFFYSLPPM